MVFRLQPSLVNGHFGDPALYVALQHKKRALLLDIGDVSALSQPQLRIISDLFVSHAHLDHFAGFDQLLRSQIDSDRQLQIFGPAGITAKIAHKLAAYSWNLEVTPEKAFSIVVTEIESMSQALQTSFKLRDKFAAAKSEAKPLRNGRLVEDHDIQVDCVLLDHKLPCLGFAIQEQASHHIDEGKLAALNLPHGTWLFRLRQALKQALPPDTKIEIDNDRGAWRLADLRRAVVKEEAGRRICYVTDCQYNESNAERIVGLARNADVLFIESKFSAADAALAHTRYHLTTDQAGLLAARAGVKTVVPFHFSQRYRDQEHQMLEEVEHAFNRAGSRRKSAKDPDTEVDQTQEQK